MSVYRAGLPLIPLGLLLWAGVPGLPETGKAAAQATANVQRIFYLRDGSVARGQLVELVPGERVVLLLPDGRVQPIAWSELLPAELQKQVEPVPVRIDTNRPIEIYQRLESGKERHLLATASWPLNGLPIAAQLPRDGHFRVGGPNVTSESFTLPRDGGAELQITAGNRSRYIAGSTLLAAGSIMAATSLFLFIGGVVNNGPEASAVGPPGWLPKSTQFYIAGGVLLSAGTLALVVGGACYATSKTEVLILHRNPSIALSSRRGIYLSAAGLEF